KDWYGGNNQGSDYLTLEFGEEHFKDLRLEHDRYDPAHDQFGRPSNEWSYKKVTIGTFPLEPDFTYTTQVAHIEETDANKEKALGLRNYDLEADGGYSYWTGIGWDSNKTPSYIQNDGITNLWLNGKNTKDEQTYFAQVKDSTTNKKVANIADFTDNGTLVEVYVSHVDADWITDVVVIQTQLMEVDKVASDYVSLDRVKPDVKTAASPNVVPNGEPNIGYNFAAIDVEIDDVKDNLEDSYKVLKELKSGDEVAVVPVTTDDGKTYEAAEVYVPETVSGVWTRVDTYGDRIVDEVSKSAISITVGGTEYKIADWNSKMFDKTNEEIKATRKDVTLLMDKYGNALKAKGIGDTSGFMVIGNFYQSLVNGKLCTHVHGWDIGGTELDLNLGSTIKFNSHNDVGLALDHELGELVRYSSKEATGDADYALNHTDVHSVFYEMKDGNVVNDGYNFQTKTNDVRIPLAVDDNASNHFCDDKTVKAAITADLAAGNDGSTLYKRHSFADRSDVKFIYVNYDKTNKEIESVEFKTGRQNATTDELASKCDNNDANFIYASQAAVDSNGEVKAVVIKRESADATLNHILYVTKYWGFNEYDRETGKTGVGVTVARFTEGGKYEDEIDIVVNKNLAIGAFASYTDLGEATINGKTVDHYYRVTPFTRHNSNPAVLRADYVNPVTYFENGEGKTTDYLLQLQNVRTINADGKAVNATTAVNNPYLDPDPLDDGRGAIDAKESYVMSTWRSHGDYVDDFVDAHGIIWTSDAQWLNMTGVKEYDKITSTKELNKYTADNDVNVTVLFNENPESNDFRVAYLIVINQISKKAGASGSINITVDGASSSAGIANAADLPKSVVLGTQFTATLADGYSWADPIHGSGLKIVTGDKDSKSITFEVIDPKGNLTINTVKDKVVEYYTLTLKGAWNNGTTDPEVWANDGATKLDLTDASTIAGKGWSVKVEENTPAPVLKVKSAAAITDGTYRTSDGTSYAVKDNIITVVMDANKTLDFADFVAASKTYAITFQDGVTPTKFAGWKGSGAVDIPLADVEHVGNTWYVTEEMQVVDVYVTTSSAEYAFAAATAIPTESMAAGKNVTQAPANAGTAQKIELGAVIDKDVTIYAATKVTIDSINPGFVGFNNPAWSSGNTTVYVVPGATLMRYADRNEISGILVNEKAALGDLGSVPFTVGTTPVTVREAVVVTLNDGVSVTADGKTFTESFYVAKNENLTNLTTTDGTAVIAGTVAAAAFNGAVNADIELSAASKLSFSAMTAKYNINGTLRDVTTGQYVKVGTKVNLEASNAEEKNLKVVTDGSSSEEVTDKLAEVIPGSSSVKAFGIWTIDGKDVTVSLVTSTSP
ncbi:hypothetical protein AALC17_12315, partial [Oscillospiraceae bacterium 38-13]